VQHSLKHHDISSSAAVFLLGRCGLCCIATQEFAYSVDCGHLKFNIFTPTKLYLFLKLPCTSVVVLYIFMKICTELL
jgi:hypothetical protein